MMIDEDEKIKTDILKTVKFFDFFSFALNIEDLYRFLPFECDMKDLKVEVDGLVSGGFLSEKDGTYFLAGREEIFDLEGERIKAGEKKLGRARLVVKIFRFIPWVRMVAVANVMGEGNFRREGDIDLFIITKKGRIWLTRLFAVLVTDILRLRPRVNDVRDKICLSFFVADDGLNLSMLLLSGSGDAEAPIERDPYFVYWLANLNVIYDDGAYSELLEANGWLREQLPNWQPDRREKIWNPFAMMFTVVDIFFSIFERGARYLQRRIVPEKIRNLKDKGTDVVMNDRVLKFHTNDRRVMYRERLMA